jgi:hypothetical protein
MSQEQDKKKPGENQDAGEPGEPGQPGSGAAGSHKPPENPETALEKNVDSSGAFVPDIAKAPEDEGLYLKADDGKGKSRWKVPTLGWFVLAGLVSGGIFASMKLALRESPVPVEQPVAIPEDLIDPRQEGEIKKVRSILEEMDNSAREYLRAANIKQKLAHVRHPRRVKALMEQYYQDHPMEVLQFHQFERYQAVDIDGSSFVVGTVVMVDGTRRQLLLEQMQNGSFRVDWESDVRYSAMPWDDFVSKRPTESVVMRVHAKPDNFHISDFDEARYDCFQLMSHGSYDYVFGYTLKGSEASIALRSLFMQTRPLVGEKAEPVTLLLRFPETGRDHKCVHIERLMAPRWIFIHGHEAAVAR